MSSPFERLHTHDREVANNGESGFDNRPRFPLSGFVGVNSKRMMVRALFLAAALGGGSSNLNAAERSMAGQNNQENTPIQTVSGKGMVEGANFTKPAHVLKGNLETVNWNDAYAGSASESHLQRWMHDIAQQEDEALTEAKKKGLPSEFNRQIVAKYTLGWVLRNLATDILSRQGVQREGPPTEQETMRSAEVMAAKLNARLEALMELVAAELYHGRHTRVADMRQMGYATTLRLDPEMRNEFYKQVATRQPIFLAVAKSLGRYGVEKHLLTDSSAPTLIALIELDQASQPTRPRQ